MARAFRSRNCLSPEAGCSGPADGNDLAEKAAERLTSCSVPSPSLSLYLYVSLSSLAPCFIVFLGTSPDSSSRGTACGHRSRLQCYVRGGSFRERKRGVVVFQ